MRRAVLLFLAACGRFGFSGSGGDGGATNDGTDDAVVTVGKADAPPMVDSGATIDDLPGMGGYTLTTGSAPYVPLAGTTVPGFALAADDDNYQFALPFTFPFYRVPYTTLTISVNGYVTFDPPVVGADTEYNDCPLDATPPGAMIAIFWDDLYASTVAPTAGLSYAVTGTAPDRMLAIEWLDMDAYYVVGSNAFTQGVRVTHTLVLHESGTIEMHYGPRSPPAYPNKDCGADRHRGCSATVGLEAPGSALFDNVQCGTAAGPGPGYMPIDEGLLLTFVPQ